jgi:mannose/fructose/N-acetylgalactosamine-specific phosphotransferase system component IIC
MNAFDLLQEKKIGWLMAGFAILGTIVALATYMNQKKHNEVEKELFELEKEIKRLELNKLKNGNQA